MLCIRIIRFHDFSERVCLSYAGVLQFVAYYCDIVLQELNVQLFYVHIEIMRWPFPTRRGMVSMRNVSQALVYVVLAMMAFKEHFSYSKTPLRHPHVLDRRVLLDAELKKMTTLYYART